MSLLPRTGVCFHCGHDHGEGMGSPRTLELIRDHGDEIKWRDDLIAELRKQLEQPAKPHCGACPDDFSKSAYCATCPEQRADHLPESGKMVANTSKPYSYHYHANYQNDAGDMVHYDGVLYCDKPIDNMARYQSMKEAIDKDNANRLIVMSLTPLKDVAPVKPIPLVLYCPRCGEQHIDDGEWATKHHKTHQCQQCKYEWRPSAYPTFGVFSVQGGE